MCGFGFGDEGAEGIGIADGDVGKDFAVEGDFRFAQAVHETAVGDVLGLTSGGEAADPKPAPCSFLGSSVAVGIFAAAVDRVVRITIELTFTAKLAFG